MNFKLGMVAVFTFVVLVFLAQNTEVVKVSFLFWELSMSRALLLLFSLMIGFIAGWVLNSYRSYRKNKRKSADLNR